MYVQPEKLVRVNYRSKEAIQTGGSGLDGRRYSGQKRLGGSLVGVWSGMIKGKKLNRTPWCARERSVLSMVLDAARWQESLVG